MHASVKNIDAAHRRPAGMVLLEPPNNVMDELERFTRTGYRAKLYGRAWLRFQPTQGSHYVGRADRNAPHDL